MAESSEVQTLEKISTEVDESQFKIILSSQCIKAQTYLVDKLRKQSEQQKQICNFISNGNLKLETEIKYAEQEVISLHSALDTIKIANVELKKELLVAKESKLAVIERVNKGIKKYNELWIVSKKRYESIPFIQNYFQIKNKTKTLQDNILNLTMEMQKLSNDINMRKRELTKLDRKYIIEVANFMVHERPQILQNIREKNNKVVELLNDIQNITREYDGTSTMISKITPITLEPNSTNDSKDVFVEDTWSNLTTDINNAMMLPKLQFRNIDLDILTIKLDQIKKVDSQNVFKRTEAEQTLTIERVPTKRITSDDIVKDVYVSSYFQSPKKIITNKEIFEVQRNKYSEKKLIHILEDIKLDNVETYNIVSNIEPRLLKDVNVIKGDIQKEPINTKKITQEKIIPLIDSKKIDEIDLTKNQSPNILIPPTQFLDLTQNSQERSDIFDTTVSVQNADTVIDFEKRHEDEIGANVIQNNQLNNSTASEENYIKIKEIIFKKHNLDLSPQFTYSKNSSVAKPETNIVTSNFFLEKTTGNIFDNTNKVQVMEIEDSHPDDKIASRDLENQEQNYEDKNTMENQNKNAKTQKDIPVTGFLFTHGPQGIPDSLNMSTSTTGYDEAESDFPPCIDSSLLLSPKAEAQLPEAIDNNSQILSQEVPNFLSGIKKTGFSFFEKSSENKSNATEQNQSNNFAFSFGSNEKRNRGFFSMFH